MCHTLDSDKLFNNELEPSYTQDRPFGKPQDLGASLQGQLGCRAAIPDHIGDREDRFFATVFLGSGIIFVVLLFVWAAAIGAVFDSYAMAADILVGNDIFIFGFAFMNQIVGNYALRMAGVYMFSISTLWTRTSVMPRWLTIVTYIVAFGFLFFAGTIREARFIFPAWVFLVSVYILITNRRLNR